MKQFPWLVLLTVKIFITFVSPTERSTLIGGTNSARCADWSRSHTTCDKKNKHCPSNNSCRYLPRAGTPHKWWCCPSKHNSRTCPNSGLRPRNQHCVSSRPNRSDGRKRKALFCRANEMCFKAWWAIASGYGLCCKAYICHDGTEASGACGEQCHGVCQKFQKYRKGILVRGRIVKKCCGKRQKKTESDDNENEQKWEAPYGGEEEIETK